MRGARRGPRTASPALLAGLIVDAAGEPLISAHACKGKVRYRYYVSRGAHHEGTGTGLRVPAPEIEAAVAQAVARALDDPLALAASTGMAIRPADIHPLTERAAELCGQATKRDPELLRALIAQVRVLVTTVEVDLAAPALAMRLGLEQDGGADPPATLTLRVDLRLTRTGRAVRLVQGDGLAAASGTDPALIGLVLKARRWWEALQAGEIDIKTLAAREGVGASWITRVLRLAFLSPAVVDAVLAGRLKASVDAAALTATGAVDPSWAEQKRALLPG